MAGMAERNEHTGEEIKSIAGRILATIREAGQRVRDMDDVIVVPQGQETLRRSTPLATVEEIKKCMASLLTQAEDR